ncbi:Peroxisomal multifunctional enzyme [Globisporangium polare]
MALRYDGRVALITGAGAGLGRCYALLFAQRGAKVVVNDFDKKAADAVVSEIKALGAEAVANYNSVVDGDKVVATAIEAFGRIDILVNNAGILRDASFVKMTKDQWNTVVAVHLQGSFAVTHAAWPHMRNQKYGRIILVTSVNGLYGQFGQTNYSSVKAAMTGFGKSLAKEGARVNIKVNIVAPGAGSKMTATVMPEEMVNAWKPEYVAPTIAYLCHESVPVSGKIFESGGGFVAQVKYVRSPGAFLDLNKEITIEAVQAKFGEITNFTNATDPDDDEISPQLKQIIPPAKL